MPNCKAVIHDDPYNTVGIIRYAYCWQCTKLAYTAPSIGRFLESGARCQPTVAKACDEPCCGGKPNRSPEYLRL